MKHQKPDDSTPQQLPLIVEKKAESEQSAERLPKPQEQLAIISRIPAPPSEEIQPQSHLSVMNYSPDQAVRQATLARPEQWIEEEDRVSYQASNNLRVYLANKKRPLPPAEALSIIRRFRASTVVTARIVLALWQTRRFERLLTINGSAGVRLDEILVWKGIKKQSVVAYPGTDIRYSNGYRTEDKLAILDDLSLLEQCVVRGQCTFFAQGKWQTFFVDDEYLRYSVVYRQAAWNERELDIAGILVSAGNWIAVYGGEGEQSHLAQVERDIFCLNPQNEQHELRIALYLTERWRDQAQTQDFAAPISMERLLEEAVIPIDKKHFTDRFIPRIEDALQQLYRKGILGAPPECLTPPNRSQTRWTRDWLAAQWVLLPPQSVIDHYRSLPVVPSLPQPTQKAPRKERTRLK